MVRSLCGTNPNTISYRAIMNSEIPEEVKVMLIGHMESICDLVGSFYDLQGKVEDKDFMLILMELCKGAFIAGQKVAVEQLKEEIIFKSRGWIK